MDKKGFAISSIIYAILILFLALIAGILGLLGNRKLILDKLKNDVITKLNNGEITSSVYKDNSGASIPELYNNMIPVVYNDGNWVYADIYSKWYDYDLKEWANAAILKDNSVKYNVGDIIPVSNIDGFFVWIPRYRYQVFNEGNYNEAITTTNAPIESAAQQINIVFESRNTIKSTGTTIDLYLTHPAFTFGDKELNGIWVAKFETSGTTSDINILPNVSSLRSIDLKTMFELAYNYNRNYDSHMMKNTEWGAVAYLSHSKYGINSEIRINNSSTFTTGCAATTPALNYVNKSQTDGSEGYYGGCENAYNTEIGVLASTTGNITGIYDMSGGSWECMSSYIDESYGSSGFDSTSISSYDNKYFDIYSSDSTGTSYNNRILGDATGELGPFYRYEDSDGGITRHSTWYADYVNFIYPDMPWLSRGGNYYYGTLSGSFSFSNGTGGSYSDRSFRIVLGK